MDRSEPRTCLDRPHLGAARRASRKRNEGKGHKLTALMRGAQVGDPTAYALLLRELLPILKRVVRARLRYLSAADGEDLVQDILLSLHAARATYDSERPFVPWLMTIAHNRMVDCVRRNWRRLASEVLVDEYPVNIPDGYASAASDRYGDHERLRRAIKALPRSQRSAIELLKLREMSLKEASRATGINMSALKVSAHRAIKSLRLSLRA